MIRKLHIQNFKCLRDVAVELSPFTVLIGKNDTGKSSLLEALHLLGGLVQAQPIAPPVSIDKLAWRGAEPPSIGWTAEIAATARNGLPQAATYALRVAASASKPGWIHVDDERLEAPGTSVRLSWGRPPSKQRQLLLDEGNKNNSEAVGDFDATALSIAWARQALPTVKSVAATLGTSPIYRIEPERAAEAAAYDLDAGEGEREPTLAPDGHGLPVLLDAILGRDRAAWDEILDQLRVAVPYVSSIRLKPARVAGPRGPVAGKALFFELRNGAEIPASLASQGVLLFLAYLALVHAATPPSILLVEEPENGIHPRQLQRVAEYLKRLVDPARGKDAVQIVAATHSPYFLDFVPPEAVLVFGRKESGETVVRPLLTLPGVKERLESGFSLGEMWFNVGEDRLLAEALA